MHKTTLAACCIIMMLSTSLLDAQWTEAQGFSGKQVLSLAEMDTCMFVGSGSSGIFRSTDKGGHWTPVNSGLSHFEIKTIAAHSRQLFVGTFSGVFSSADHGTTWTPRGLNGDFIEALLSVGPYLFAGTNTGVYRSVDNGVSWQATNNGLSNTNVRALAVNGDRLYAGTWGEGEGIFTSIDFGDTWMLSNTGLSSYDVSTFASIGTDVFAGTNGGGIFRSVDDGAHWTKADTGLTNGIVGILFAEGENLFAGTFGGGIFLSTTRGHSWTAVNAGLPFLYIGPITMIGSDLYAGTFGSGLYKRPIGSMPVTYSSIHTVELAAAWNLVSVPFVTGFSAADSLFTMADAMYEYTNASGSYSPATELAAGNGYWARYSQAGTETAHGFAKDHVEVIARREGWMLFGSLNNALPVDRLISEPAGSMMGNAYEYNNTLSRYETATQIVPGKGYWVYVTQPCRLILR